MSQTGRPNETGGERPPKRLLDQPPSERLAAAGGTSADSGGAAGAAGTSAGSPGRALAYGLAAAVLGAALHLGVATLLLWTAGLLVVATVIGIIVGLAVAVGGGAALRPRSRRTLALVLALSAVLVAVGVSWALSGMFLGPLDYVLEVYGLLVPAQLVLAAAGAIAGAR